MLLVGGGIASFISFNEKQQLLGAARELQTYLRSAQTRARTGTKDDSCEALESYQVAAGNGANSFAVSQICDGGSVINTQSHDLPSSVTFSDDFNLRFRVLAGATDGAQIIALQAFAYRYEFAVTLGGEIQEGDFTE